MSLRIHSPSNDPEKESVPAAPTVKRNSGNEIGPAAVKGAPVDFGVPPAPHVKSKPTGIEPKRDPRRLIIPQAEVDRLKSIPVNDALQASGLIRATRRESRDTRFWLSGGSQVITTGNLYNEVTPAHRYHGKNSIDLAQQITGGDFRSAVEWLQQRFPPTQRISVPDPVTGREVVVDGPPPPPPNAISFFSSKPPAASFTLPPQMDDSEKVVVDYLVSRGIDPDFARNIFSANLVYATKAESGHINLVWPMIGADDAPCAALLRGTTGVPDSSTAYRGKIGTGGVWLMSFGSANLKTAPVIRFFENPMDAVSHAQLRDPEVNSIYISIGGLNGLERLIPNLHKINPDCRIVVAIDNDPAGDEAWKKFVDQVPHLTREIPERKDWNADLRLGPLPPPTPPAEIALEKYLEPKNDRQRKEVTDELLCFRRFLGQPKQTDAQTFATLISAGAEKIDAYLAHELGRGLSKATINNKRSRLKKLVESARASGLSNWSVQPALQKKTEPALRQVKPLSPVSELVSSTKVDTPPSAAVDIDHAARQLMTDWLGAQSSPNTIRAYANAVISLQRHLGLDAPEEAVASLLRGGNDLAAAHLSELSTRLAPKTVRTHKAALASLIRAAHDRGLCNWTLKTSWKHENPIHDMSGPTRDAVNDCIDALQARAAADPSRRLAALRDIAIIEVGSRPGLRASELASLRYPNDVDLKEPSEIWPKRKGEKLRTCIQIDGPALDALKAYLEVRGDRPGALWLTEKGAPMTESGIRRMIRRLNLRRMGDPSRPSGSHGLRHLAAQEVYERAGVKAAAVTLGHRDRHNESTIHYIIR